MSDIEQAIRRCYRERDYLGLYCAFHDAKEAGWSEMRTWGIARSESNRELLRGLGGMLAALAAIAVGATVGSLLFR